MIKKKLVNSEKYGYMDLMLPRFKEYAVQKPGNIEMIQREMQMYLKLVHLFFIYRDIAGSYMNRITVVLHSLEDESDRQVSI